MRAQSASTELSDPYRAGLALGEALRPLAPEIVFLFSAVHQGTPEMLEGLYDALENDELIVLGNTGDGFYASNKVGDLGASALGLNSDGAVRWRLSSVGDIAQDPANAVRRAIADLKAQAQGDSARLMFLFSDFRVDASTIESVLQHEVDCPVVGGLAADDNRMAQCALYANRKALQNALVVGAAYGDIRFDIQLAHRLRPVGRPGTVDEAKGNQIQRIDGIGAMDFIMRETGKPVLQTDRGITSLMLMEADNPAERRLRSIVPDFSTGEGTLGLYCGIETGKEVQVHLAEPQELIDEVHEIAAGLNASAVDPAAALVVSCAGRKWLLGDEIGHEVSALGSAFPAGLPLTGFCSFGEIGPLRTAQGYSRNLFHNMTYILLLIGR
jgi:hypothetical protein